MKKPKIPRDLGVKMGTVEQIVWENVAKGSRVTIENCEKELIAHRAILQLAEEKIAEEKAKL